MESASASLQPPAGDDAALRRAWQAPPGFTGWLTAVNHKAVGMRFIVTGLGFLVVGGVLALLMRTQLASAESGFLDAETFNEAFTMHGTIMMTLFAVPILEGLGMYMLPLLLGTRDLPFPRLSAFGYWAYLFGGLFVLSSFISGDAPSEGWFAYTPLSGAVFAPGDGMDYWLLGITLVEISGIIGAIELLTGFIARRSPGMSINRIPIFAWAVFVMAAMIIVAFPALIVASVMLELERAFGFVFFEAAMGGDPLLWQHLFWFFGHPEVYIMLIPAVGIVSTVVPAFSRRRLAGYPYVVAALVAIGLISFALWVHHMFTTGIALVGLSFFAAASFLIVIPSGVQVFAWLATMWRGRPEFRPPLLFVLGFLVIFLMGGITGVMVAAVPLDWQVHDSYFVVAHFHYVLIGGVLFPIFGGLYHWFPKWTGKLMSERWGYASFWTMFVGFNVAFFPQHLLGFEGMPRRVFTYRAAEGWDLMNLISTIGAFVLALGITITLVNMLVAWRRGREAGPNPWGAGSLEWAADSPPAPYNFQELRAVDSSNPLWREPLRPAGQVGRTIRELTAPREDEREVFETSPIKGQVLGVAALPGPSAWPLLTVIPLTVGLLAALFSQPYLMVVAFALTAASAIGWAAAEPREGPGGEARRTLGVWHAGGGWWGAVMLAIAVGSMLGGLWFGYVYLAAGAEAWPPAGVPEPSLGWLVAGALAAILAALCAWLASRKPSGLLLSLTALLLVAAVAAAGLWLGELGAAPTEGAYGSIVFTLFGFLLGLAAAAAAAAGITAWRLGRGLIHPERRVGPRVVALGVAFVAVAWIVSAAIAYVTPRL